MTPAWLWPAAIETSITVSILAGSYLVARVISWSVGRLFERTASRTSSNLDDRLLSALKRPLTYALFLLGANAAIERLQVEGRWMQRLDALLFVFGVLILTLALMRAYGIVMAWYATESVAARDGELAAEFGPFLNKLGKVFLVLIAVITVLERFQVDVRSLVVSLGVGSLAVGLAAQDTLANMFAGFTLMLDRPFKVGERISLSTGEVGDVVAIGMRATRIRTLDDTILIVPNSILVKDRVTNLTQPSRNLTLRINVGVAYATDLERAKGLLATAARECPLVEPAREPVVLATQFADFSINLMLICWAKDYEQAGLAGSAVREAIHKSFAREGVEIPFPIRKVLHDGPAGPAAGAA
ncbi:MAG: mechanosensitive ion channel family protein [Vicinamibacteria bacterium]|nr:mechanosensitive ion channel family protein [Vicinamibacteria bacterium]